MKKLAMNLILVFASIFTLCLSFLLVFPMLKSESVSLFLNNPIFIDPGHGGKDDGANCDNVQEDEINLKIALKLYEQIINSGGTAIISRIGDYDLASLYATNRKREDLNKRVEYINHSGAKLFVSIHLNAYRSSSVYGPMVYYRAGDKKSNELAEYVMDELNELAHDDKEVHGEDYYLFRKTTVLGILVECGFITNSSERALLLTDSYQQKISNSIIKGIKNFLLSQQQA